jgi:hypothetical protein
MALRQEAQAQLARLLSNDALRSAPPQALPSAVDAAWARLVDGLVAEAAASDDVIDRPSAVVFLRDRVAFLADLLSDDQRQRLARELEERVAAW